jgi:anti-anti-sigma regulatory factor
MDDERQVGSSGSRSLSVEARNAAGETHLTLAGDVDVAGEIDLRAEAAAIQRYKPLRLTIDLRDVGFIDVRGAESLSTLIDIARSSGAEVTVVAVPASVRAALDKIGGDFALE